MPIITENNYTFTSADGATPIHVREWVPDCDINGVVQIAHGINEYIGRYEHFARYLASKGFVVVGNDHLGHGESVLGPEFKYKILLKGRSANAREISDYITF